MTWIYDHDAKPPEDGWYPVLHCWDSEEGVIPSAAFWSEGKWRDTQYVLQWWDQRFDDKQAADDIAYANDPER